jgi:hypothetical protein
MKKIAIHSVPRSGSSWLGEIINSSPEVSYAFQPLFSYEFKSQLSDTSSVKDIEKFYVEISQTADSFVRQVEERALGRKPSFLKNNPLNIVAYKEVRYHYIIENLLRKDPQIKLIGLVRNPYAVINSWFNAPREFRCDLGWKLQEELMNANKKNRGKKEEYFGLNKWIETTSLFERLKATYPVNFCLVRYEELCRDTIPTVKKIYSFLELDYTEQTDNFLKMDKQVNGTYSVMRNKMAEQPTKVQLSENIMSAMYDVLSKNNLSQYVEITNKIQS